jgi:hypothetical protein
MASVNANTPNPSATVAITRGVQLTNTANSRAIASLTATASVAQFSLVQESSTPDGLEVLVIATSGGTIATPVLTASIDGGLTWFTVSPRAAVGTAPNYTLTAQNGDTAATSANCYDVSGLQANALFRFGGASAFPVAVFVSYG